MTAMANSAPEQLDDWADEDSEADETQLVTFRTGDEEYGIHIMQVQEILRMGAITRLPSAPHYVEGIMGLRGNVLLVIDLRKRLNLPPQERSHKKSRIVVVNHEGKTIGLIVDSISSVLRLSNAAIKPASEIAAMLRATHVYGIGSLEKRLIVILATDQLLSGEEIQAVEIQAVQAYAAG